MALDPLEIGVIALMGIAVFIWGPEKIPEIARQIGSARKQLDGYTKQLQGISKELQTSLNTGNIDNLGNVLAGTVADTIPSNPGAQEVSKVTNVSPGFEVGTSPVTAPSSAISPTLPVPAPVVQSADQLLIDMARKLGITTQGKTRDDIQSEIVTRASQPEQLPSPAQAATATEASQPTAAASPPLQGADMV